MSSYFDPMGPTESPATSYAASRPLSHPLTPLNPSRALHFRALFGKNEKLELKKKKIKKKSEKMKKMKNRKKLKQKHKEIY